MKDVYIQNVMDADWDLLLMLDACRYDTFKVVNTIAGDLEPRWSPASNTEVWWIQTFWMECKDVVYLSSHPSMNSKRMKLPSADSFHKVVDVWDEGWDVELTTVHPDTMVKETIKAIDEYEDKRILTHFMQPHCPYIGTPTIKGLHMHPRDFTKQKLAPDANIAILMETGRLNINTVMDAYVSNLQVVLESCKKLVNLYKDKKIIITSDHGELFGEYGMLFHSLEGYIWPFPEVRIVPWFTTGGGK